MGHIGLNEFVTIKRVEESCLKSKYPINKNSKERDANTETVRYDHINPNRPKNYWLKTESQRP